MLPHPAPPHPLVSRRQARSMGACQHSAPATEVLSTFWRMSPTANLPHCRVGGTRPPSVSRACMARGRQADRRRRQHRSAAGQAQERRRSSSACRQSCYADLGSRQEGRGGGGDLGSRPGLGYVHDHEVAVLVLLDAQANADEICPQRKGTGTRAPTRHSLCRPTLVFVGTMAPLLSALGDHVGEGGGSERLGTRGRRLGLGGEAHARQRRGY